MKRKKPKQIVTSELGIPLPVDLAKELDALLKTLPSEQRKLRVKSAAPNVSEVSLEKRTEVSVITTQSVDLEGEVVISEGIDRSLFNRNPVVCLGHDMSLQVGKCLWVKPTDDGLKAKTYYPEKPDWYQESWLPDQVFAAIQAGLMQGKSIGYIELSARMPTNDELRQRPEWQDAKVIDKALLIEYSACVRGINQDSMVEMVAKGIRLDPALLARLGIKIEPTKKRTDLTPMIVARLKSLNIDTIINKALANLANRGRV